MFRITFYFMRFMSEGADEYSSKETLEEAISEARKRVKENYNSAAHATIVNDYGKLCATIVKSKGRILTKKR